MRREVLALREALEQARYTHEAEMGRVIAIHRADSKELQSIAVALREQMESLRREHLEELQTQARASAAEIRALQESLQAARSSRSRRMISEARRI